MKTMAAGKAKNGFGLLIDTARAEPVTIEKHGRPVAVVMSVEEYERLMGGAGVMSRRKRYGPLADKQPTIRSDLRRGRDR